MYVRQVAYTLSFGSFIWASVHERCKSWL